MKKFQISAAIARQVPLSAPTLFRGNFVDNIHRAAKIGFDGIELQFKLPGEIDVQGIKNACEETGLSVSAIATGTVYTQDGISLIDDSQDVCKEAQKRLKAYVDIAAKLGGKVIVGCMRGNLRPNDELEQIESRLAKNLWPVLRYAGEHGQKMVIEAINHFENNYMCTAAACVDFIKKYEMENLEILLDTYHMNMEEAGKAEAIKTAGKLLGHFHLADNIRLAPGWGEYDFKTAIKALDDIGYTGWLSFECAVRADENEEAEAGLAFIKRHMA